MTARSQPLTIVVMTYNRYSQLLRLLRYAVSVQSPYPMVVLDSSSDTAPGELPKWLRAAGAQYRTSDTTIPPMHKLRDGLSRVSTPYVVQWADDDFLVPGSLAQGVQWLASHPDYSVAHGHGALFLMEESGDRLVPACMPYWQRAILQDTAVQRLRDQLGHHSVLNYSIHHTADLMRHVELCCRYEFGYTWAELVLGALAVIQGKAMKMDRLYLVKEAHAGTDAWWAWLRRVEQAGRALAPDVFDWVTEESFPSKYAAFRDCLAGALSQQDGIAFDQAQGLVKEACWSYVANVLAKKRPRREEAQRRTLRARVRAAARQVPAARSAWRMVQSWLSRYDQMCLPALLRHSSPYHDDFMPIYQALTTTIKPPVLTPGARAVEDGEPASLAAAGCRDTDPR